MRIRVAGAIVLVILSVVAVSAFFTLGLVEELKVEEFREDDGALVADLVDGLQNRVAGIHIGSIDSCRRRHLAKLRGSILQALPVTLGTS